MIHAPTTPLPSSPPPHHRYPQVMYWWFVAAEADVSCCCNHHSARPRKLRHNILSSCHIIVLWIYLCVQSSMASVQLSSMSWPVRRSDEKHVKNIVLLIDASQETFRLESGDYWRQTPAEDACVLLLAWRLRGGQQEITIQLLIVCTKNTANFMCQCAQSQGWPCKPANRVCSAL